MRHRKLTCGFCQSKNHRLCPTIMQHHRFTPKGKELREIVCACTCGSERRRVSRPSWEEARLPGCEE